MGKPRFNLKNRNQNPTLISLIYRFNGKRLVYSTGMFVSPKDWNPRNMRVRETAGNFDSGFINDQLDKLEEIVLKSYRTYRKNDVIPTVREFKDTLDVEFKGKKRSDISSFTGFIDHFIKKRTASTKYASGTIKVYKTTQNHFNSYSKNKTVEFGELTREYLDNFIQHLWDKGFSDNYVNKIFRTIRTFLNEAYEQGLLDNTKYKSRQLTVPKREADSIYLDMKELQQLYNLDLSENKRLERVRDLFLIGACTGLRYSDFTNLTSKNLVKVDGIEVFKVHSVKTKETLYIPIHSIVKHILEKNKGIPPKPISNQKMNEYLKELCKLAGLKEPIIKRIYRSNKPIEESFQKWELVSSHTARRSFATNAYKSGIDAISIMRITGHKTHEMFMKYIKVDKQENAVRMAKHNFFK